MIEQFQMFEDIKIFIIDLKKIKNISSPEMIKIIYLVQILTFC